MVEISQQYSVSEIQSCFLNHDWRTELGLPGRKKKQQKKKEKTKQNET